MRTTSQNQLCIVLALGLISATGTAANKGTSGEACVDYGPQTPRDIDNRAGENKRIFSLAPS